MNRFILVLFLLLLAFPVAAQLQFKERTEIPAESFEPIYELMRIPSGGLVAFRTFQQRKLNADLVFEYFLSSELLQSDTIKEVKVKEGFDMIGYDIDVDQLYVLFAKGDDAAADKYVLHLDLKTHVGMEYAADNLLPMDLVEFLVLDKKVIFMGNADARPVVQIFFIGRENRPNYTGNLWE